MKPPKSVQVGAVAYTVREPKTVADAEIRENSWGVTNHKTQTILVSAKQAADVLADTVLHEVLHCCWFNSGLAAEEDKTIEERAIRTITPILLDTLRRNPKLVTFLLGPEETAPRRIRRLPEKRGQARSITRAQARAAVRGVKQERTR